MRLGLLVCALALLFARSAEAQAGSLTFTVARIESPGGGVRDAVEEGLEINSADCDTPADTDITIRASAAPAGGLSFDLWVALVNDCEAVTTRAGTTQTCFDINRQISQLEDNNTFTVTLAELTVGLDGEDRDPCREIQSAAGGNYYLHVFESQYESTTVELGSIRRGVAAIPVDITPPATPVLTSGNVSGGNGVNISWETPTGDADSQNYEYQFFNLGSCGGASDGGVVVDGGSLDGGAAGTPIGEPFTAGSSSTINPARDLGLSPSEGALVALQAIDVANNTSELSAPVCVTYVPSGGFCASFGAEGGGDCGNCSVSAPGSHASGGVAGLAGVVAALGLAIFRSRRNRRSRA